MQRSKMYYFHLLVYAGLNPKLPDFMLPKKKASSAAKAPVDEPTLEEPVAGTSTGGETVQVIYLFVLFVRIQCYPGMEFIGFKCLVPPRAKLFI